MKQGPNDTPFISVVVAAPSGSLAGRWAGLVEGSPIARPAKRRAPGEKPVLHLNAVRALAHLLDGDVNLRLVVGHEKTLVAEIEGGGETHSILYRICASQVYSSDRAERHPDTLVMFAARLLAMGIPVFSYAYLALAQAVTDGADPREADALMATAADELIVACVKDLGLDQTMTHRDLDGDFITIWFHDAKADRDVLSEFADHTAIALTPLFADGAVFARYLAGESTPFDAADSIPLPKTA